MDFDMHQVLAKDTSQKYNKTWEEEDPSQTPTCTISPTTSAFMFVYIDDLMLATQGERAQQERVTELTLRALKEIFPSLPKEVKNSVSIKKALQGDEDWETTKEVLG